MEMKCYSPITNTLMPEYLIDKTHQDINHAISELDYISYEIRLVVDALDTMLGFGEREAGEIKYGALRIADDFLTARAERLTEVIGNLQKMVNS